MVVIKVCRLGSRNMTSQIKGEEFSEAYATDIHAKVMHREVKIEFDSERVLQCRKHKQQPDARCPCCARLL